MPIGELVFLLIVAVGFGYLLSRLATRWGHRPGQTSGSDSHFSPNDPGPPGPLDGHH
jgi:hypothetical protein